MNTKKALAWVGVIVVLALIALAFSLIPKPAVAPVLPAAATKSPVLGGVATSSGAYDYVENQPYYTVDVTYPAQLPLVAAASAKAELTMEQALADDIAQFKTDGDFTNLTAADAQTQGLDGTRKYAYAVSYTHLRA